MSSRRVTKPRVALPPWPAETNPAGRRWSVARADESRLEPPRRTSERPVAPSSDAGAVIDQQRRARWHVQGVRSGSAGSWIAGRLVREERDRPLGAVVALDQQ